MARAVIELSGDIRKSLPVLNRKINGFDYNPRTHMAAFNIKGMPVTIIGNKITIYNTKSEAVARDVMESLKEALSQKKEKPER